MSSQIIPADLLISEAQAKELVRDQFNINVTKSSLLGEGFDNAVYFFNDHLVFRFPRRRIAIELIELELNLLPTLKEHLPLAIPEPRYRGRPCAAYDAPFYGHEILPGKSGCEVELSSQAYARLASDLAAFLKVLHGLCPDKLKLNANQLKALFDRLDRKQMLIWLNNRYDAVKTLYDLSSFHEKFENIIHNSSNYARGLCAPIIVHGDLYHRHLLFNDGGNLSGIIDWGDSCLSERVVDLAIVFQFLPRQAHDDFFKAYGDISKEESDYARFLGLYYAITLLWFGNDRKDKRLIGSSLKALEQI